MRKNPALLVDWDSGEGQVDLGYNLTNADPLIKVDILGDFKRQMVGLYDKAHEEMYPGLAGMERRANNQLRRSFCEGLAGLSVVTAKPLTNGDVAIQLSDGRTLVFCAEEEPVNIRITDSIQAADEGTKYMASRETIFTEEPTEEDALLSQTHLSAMHQRQFLGIDAPV